MKPIRVAGTGKTADQAVKDWREDIKWSNQWVKLHLQFAQTDYDRRTDNGRDQSAIGGVDVKLTCP